MGVLDSGVPGRVLWRGHSLVVESFLRILVMSLLCIVCASLISSVDVSSTNWALLDKYNNSTGQYDQSVSMDGKIVSRLSTS